MDPLLAIQKYLVNHRADELEIDHADLSGVWLTGVTSEFKSLNIQRGCISIHYYFSEPATVIIDIYSRATGSGLMGSAAVDLFQPDSFDQIFSITRDGLLLG